MNLTNVNFNKLQVFLAVARQGSVARAASSLGLTGSAVSQSLMSFEASIGVELFRRVGRSWELTAAGRKLFAGAARYEDGILATLRSVIEVPAPPEEPIRLGAFLGFSGRSLGPLLAEFMQRHPSIRVKMVFASPSELDAMLRKGKLDLALSIYGARSDPKIRTTRVYREEMLLLSAQKPLKRPLAMSELLAAPFVDYYENSPLIRRWVQHHFRRRADEIHIRAFVATAELVIELISRNIGIGVVPRSVAQPYIEQGLFHVIRGQRKQLFDECWLKEPREGRRSSALELFRTELLRHFDR